MERYKCELNGEEYTVRARTVFGAARQVLAKQGYYPKEIWIEAGNSDNARIAFKEKVGLMESSLKVMRIHKKNI